jgi:hypothetical protein
LIEITIRLADAPDYRVSTDTINSVADDFDLHSGDWYGDPRLRVGSATKEALKRLFGWEFIRVNLERYQAETGTWGTSPDFYRWEALNEPELQRFPVPGLITSIGWSQPGSDDDGQWYD